LPSPLTAQKYRVENLYTGPKDDECATAIRNCDPNGPLMIYISKMIPAANLKNFYAFGRVFSGTVSVGQKVQIMGSDYVVGEKNDVFFKNIRGVALMMSNWIETVESLPCGNTVGLVGIDQFLLKSGTISTSEKAHLIAPMKFSVSPVVRVAVLPKNPPDLPKLIAGLKLLSKSDPCLKVLFDESTGENIVAGAGELHLETSLNDLREFLGDNVPIIVSTPVVGFAETVTEKGDVCLAKSPNKHNRLYVYAEPLEEGLSEAIDKGSIKATDDMKTRGKYLTDNFKWDPNAAKKIWCLGPNHMGPNILVDQTHAVQYLNEIKDSMNSAFNWAASEGVICGEPMRGVRFNLQDVSLHADTVHRGGGQIIPTAHRVYFAAQMTAKPRIMEPVYLVEIQTVQSVVGAIYGLISRKRGFVVNEEPKSGTPYYVVKAHLPVLESFGFASELRAATSGRAFPQMVFDHWRIVDSDPYESGTLANQIALSVRKRKKLPPNFPSLDQYRDTL